MKSSQAVGGQRTPHTPAGVTSQGRIPAQTAPVPDGALVARVVAPQRLLPADVLTLQRTVGNQAVLRLMQQRAGSLSASPAPTPVIQPKLRVGPAHDAAEIEADRIAAHIHVPAPPTARTVRRAPHPAPAALYDRDGGPLTATLEGALRQTQGGGQPLPDTVRRSLEPKLGADLQPVKVHTDAPAVQLNRALGAKAFTYGKHIYYGAGQSPHDLRLTAHEAVHTIQQGAVRQGAGPQPGVQRAMGSQPVPHITTGAQATQRIQRLTSQQEDQLRTKIGQYKFNKAQQAGKLDELFAKSDQELDTIRSMPRNQFDTLLQTMRAPTTGGTTTGSGTPPTTTTPQGTPPPSPQGKIAWLFEKVRNGAIAFANSSKFAFDTETLLPKLLQGLTGKLTGEVTSESFKLEVAGLQIPFSSLAATELDMKLAAKLGEKEAPPTTLGERVSGLGGKALEGADLPDLMDRSLGMKSTQETGFSFSPTKLLSELNAPQKNLKLLHRPGSSPGGTPSPGVEFSGEGSVGGKIRLLFGQLRDLAEKYVGNPLRELELKVKEYILDATSPESTEEGGQQSTLGWLLSSGGSMLSSLGSGIMSGVSKTDTYLGGYGKSMVGKVWDWSSWAMSLVPDWVRSWLPTFNKEGLRAWFEDRTKFLEKLNPNKAMPKLSGFVETKGTYVGGLQVEDMDTDVGVDLNIPESYVATWAKEIQDRFLPESSLAQMLSAGLGGKVSLFKLKGYSFSRAKGFRGLVPSVNLGPGLAMLWSLFSRMMSFAKQAASALFNRLIP